MKDYREIDLEAASYRMAEIWFEEFEKGIKPKNLYDDVLEESHGMYLNRTVKPEYAILFFQKQIYFREVLDSYCK